MGFDNICFKSFSPDKMTGVLHKQATAVTVSQLDARRLICSGIFDGKPDLVGSTWEREFRNQPESLKNFKPQEGDYELLAAVTKSTLEGLMESCSAGVIDPCMWDQDIAFDQLKEKVPEIVTIPEAPGRSKHIPDHVLSLTKQRGADKDDDEECGGDDSAGMRSPTLEIGPEQLTVASVTTSEAVWADLANKDTCQFLMDFSLWISKKAIYADHPDDVLSRAVLLDTKPFRPMRVYDY